MMAVLRAVAALGALVLVGLPFVVLPSRLLAVPAGAAALLCASGIARLSVPVSTAGVTLAAIEYALALWTSDAPPNVLIAALFGTALYLLLAVVDFAGRIRGAAVDGAVWNAMSRYWLAIAAAGLGLMTALGGGAAVVRLALPPSPDPLLVVLGTVGALAAAGGVFRLVAGADDTPRDDADGPPLSIPTHGKA